MSSVRSTFEYVARVYSHGNRLTRSRVSGGRICASIATNTTHPQRFPKLQPDAIHRPLRLGFEKDQLRKRSFVRSRTFQASRKPDLLRFLNDPSTKGERASSLPGQVESWGRIPVLVRAGARSTLTSDPVGFCSPPPSPGKAGQKKRGEKPPSSRSRNELANEREAGFFSQSQTNRTGDDADDNGNEDGDLRSYSQTRLYQLEWSHVCCGSPESVFLSTKQGERVEGSHFCRHLS
jgi:hypothetical protein